MDRSNDNLHDLELLLRSRVPLLVVETRDEPGVLALFSRLASRIGQPVLRWSVTTGLQRLGLDLVADVPAADPDQVLEQIRGTAEAGIYLLLDFHPYLNDPARVRMIREIAMGYGAAAHTLVLVSPRCELPAELRAHAAHHSPALPDAAALHAIVREEARHWMAHGARQRVRSDKQTLQHLVAQLRGLTAADARRLVRLAIHDDGAITDDDLPRLLAEKYRLLDASGALSLEPETADFAEVGGLDHLKRWLARRRDAFKGRAPELDPPRGILLTGVQGAGKSLAARAAAGLWALPLLRLDFGTLYNKFYGETERNLRDALRTAEAMAPCVLWIDEIEKAVADGNDESGTASRVLGTFLTWLAEHRAPVFVVATANRIERLPPELVRKGRFDEIFFVDLPDTDTRARIFEIHLRKRGQDPSRFDVSGLAAASEGFSGAEIEQAVVAGLYLAREQGAPLDQPHLMAELGYTRPLSRVMAEQIAALRAWARERTVLAD